MRNLIALLFLCSTSFLYSIDITINSASIEPGEDCLAKLVLNYDITIANAGDDGNMMFPGDMTGVLIRDANCNVLGWSFFGFVDGNDMDQLLGMYDNMTTFPPDSRPFTLSFHDITSEVMLDEILDTPPLATLDFDPSAAHANCAALPDLGTPDCPFAEVEVVPTMGEWAIISLTLLLLIFGVVAIRREPALVKLN